MAKYNPSTLTGDLAPINAELEKIRDAINDQLDRAVETGVTNSMGNDLDMNSNNITNLAAPVNDNDAARKADVDAIAVADNLITGDVGSTDNALVRSDGTGGLGLQGSTATLTDSGILTVTQVVTTSITDGTATLTGGDLTGVGAITATGLLTCGTVDTGQGATEVYLQDQNLRSSDDVTFNNITVDGNLVVNGTTTTVDSTTLTVVDPLVVFGQGNASDTLDLGWIGVRASNNVGVIWDESSDEFALIETTDDGSTSGNVAITSYADLQVKDLTAVNISGTITTATQGTIDHDSLANYVANEHIDWTSTASNLSTTGTIQGAGITSTSGLTVSSGTTAVQALTATTVTASSNYHSFGSNHSQAAMDGVNGVQIAPSSGSAAVAMREASTNRTWLNFVSAGDGSYNIYDSDAGAGAVRFSIDTSGDCTLNGNATISSGDLEVSSGSLGVGVDPDSVSAAKINGVMSIADGVTAPATTAGYAHIYVDSADGDLKVKFGDGTVKTIMTDT